MGGGSVVPPPRAASQAAQSFHQLPSWRSAFARHCAAEAAAGSPSVVVQYAAPLPPGGVIMPAMAAGGQYLTHAPTHQLSDPPGRVPWYDVVFLRADRVDI